MTLGRVERYWVNCSTLCNLSSEFLRFRHNTNVMMAMMIPTIPAMLPPIIAPWLKENVAPFEDSPIDGWRSVLEGGDCDEVFGMGGG